LTEFGVCLSLVTKSSYLFEVREARKIAFGSKLRGPSVVSESARFYSARVTRRKRTVKVEDTWILDAMQLSVVRTRTFPVLFENRSGQPDVTSYKVDGISGSVEWIVCGALERLDDNGIT